MSLNHTLAIIALVGTSAFALASGLSGQVPDSSATAAVQSDSQTASADAARRADTSGVSSSDSLRSASPDSVPTDTARASSDSVKPAARDSGRSSAVSQAPNSVAVQPPVDSVLAEACQSGESLARDLLVVVFSDEAGAEERKVAARSVRGTLLGPVNSEPGAYYLRVPSGGEEFQLRAAADQLAQLSQVQQVASQTCPVQSQSP
jgi:hypothetical protein